MLCGEVSESEVNLMKRVLLVFCFLSLFAIATQAQSQCACQCRGCSVSQTCPAGKITVCTCSATGCSSRCEDDNLPIEGFTDTDFESAFETGDAKALRRYFSRTIGKRIDFVPDSKNPAIRFASSEKNSHWEALAYLDKIGELTIDGHTLKFWTDMRDSFQKGGLVVISTSRADKALREISFISGKKLHITSGDPKTRIDGPISGNGLDEFLENLGRAAGLTIASR